MKKRITIGIVALLCASLFCLTGCGTTQLAGGTETQNPEIVACVKKMAEAAFDAADVGDTWRPAHYLEDSTRAGLSRKLAKRLANPAADTSSSLISGGRPDTMNIGDSGVVIRDTVLVLAKVVMPQTILIDKTIFIADTIADTIRTATGSGMRTSVMIRVVNDSVIVKDTVVLFDTVVHYYKRVIASVQSNAKGAGATTVQTDTNWIDLGGAYELSGNPAPIDGRSADAAISQSWQVAEINYSKATSSLSYSMVSPPTKDTMVLAPGPEALKVRNNQMFLSSTTFDNSILVETVRFNAIDSLLSIVRFNPSPFDTVESLSVNYSIDLGNNTYSGTDDQLLGIERSYRCRLGKILHLDLAVSPNTAESLGSSNKIYNGMIAIKLSLSNNTSGGFNGAIDKIIGLYGVFELNGKKYQVNCDHLYTTNIIEMK